MTDALGIIGGADGPTAILVSGPAGGLPLAGLLLRRKGKK